jgi:hypothetical protein
MDLAFFSLRLGYGREIELLRVLSRVLGGYSACELEK